MSDFNKFNTDWENGFGIKDAIQEGTDILRQNVLLMATKLEIRNKIKDAISRGKDSAHCTLEYEDYDDSIVVKLIEMLTEEGLVCSHTPPKKGCCSKPIRGSVGCNDHSKETTCPMGGSLCTYEYYPCTSCTNRFAFRHGNLVIRF